MNEQPGMDPVVSFGAKNKFGLPTNMVVTVAPPKPQITQVDTRHSWPADRVVTAVVQADRYLVSHEWEGVIVAAREG